MADSQENETIEALTHKFADALGAGDFSAVGSMYTDDAVICPPASNIVVGKRNVQSYWERNDLINGLRFLTIVIKPLSESAVRVVGTLSLQLRAPPGDGGDLAGEGPEFREMNGKYIFVWQKQNGQWKIDSSIWNGIGRRRRGGGAVRRLVGNDREAGPRGRGGFRGGMAGDAGAGDVGGGGRFFPERGQRGFGRPVRRGARFETGGDFDNE